MATTTPKTTRKATHTGTCQACGCSQKLPAGRLSLHGYTTRWGFFSGTCDGATHLPFEQDRSLIEFVITKAQNRATALRERAKLERETSNPEDCWYNIYFEATWNGDKGGYRWTKTKLSKGPFGVCYWMADGKDSGKWKNAYSGTSGDLDAAAQKFADKYARTLEKEAAQCDEYVRWQESRIQNWVPTALTPIK